MIQVVSIKGNKKFRIIIVVVSVCIIVFGTIYYIKVYKPERLAIKAYQIVNNEDLSQIEFLEKVLMLDTDHFLLQGAQVGIMWLFTKYRMVEEIDLIVDYYNRSEDPHLRTAIIGGMGRIGTIKTVDFLEKELAMNNNLREIKSIYLSLFKIYFQESEDQKEIQRKIYKIYNGIKLSDKELLLRKYLIKYFEGEKDYLQELKDIAYGTDNDLKKELVDIFAFEIENKNLIRNNKAVVDIIQELYKDNEYRNYLEGYY